MSRFLCVTNPYRDPEKLKEQKEYWKFKYNIELEKAWLVDILIQRRIKHLDTNNEKVVALITKRPYTFPLETLEPNKNQKEYKVIIANLEDQNQSKSLYLLLQSYSYKIYFMPMVIK